MFSYYDSIFPSGVTTMPFMDNNRTEEASVVPTNPNIKRALFFVTPKDATLLRKNYSGLGKEQHPDAQTIRDADGPIFSYIVFQNSNPNDAVRLATVNQANLSFAIEGCQEAVRATSPLNNEDAQEVVCNSVGQAYAARQRGMSYNDYYSFFSRGVMSVINAPLILHTQDSYNAMPKVTPIFTAKKN